MQKPRLSICTVHAGNYLDLASLVAVLYDIHQDGALSKQDNHVYNNAFSTLQQ